MASDRLQNRTASIHRMVMDNHICPYGLKAKDLLERRGFEVHDHWLTTRQETDAFQEKHGVETTPQIFFGDERIGGYDELRQTLAGKSGTGEKTSYQPVIAIFAVAFAIALAMGHVAMDGVLSIRILEWFIAVSMTLLALQKLQNLEGFSLMFLNYDLLAQRWVPYAYVYPFAEVTAGVLMVAGILPWFSAPLALFIGLVGAISVFKAVYIDKRELKCACVGGDSNVPLGFISLTENLMMLAMGIWVLVKTFSVS